MRGDGFMWVVHSILQSSKWVPPIPLGGGWETCMLTLHSGCPWQQQATASYCWLP